MEFLNEYRLKKAVELLVSTDMPITEVCFAWWIRAYQLLREAVPGKLRGQSEGVQEQYGRRFIAAWRRVKGPYQQLMYFTLPFNILH